MSKQRAKGTRWETAIRDYLQAEGIEVHRQPAHGVNDKGDLHVGTDIVIEAKNQQRHSLSEWLDEATSEAANAGRPVGLVWFHRRGKGHPRDGYVLMDGRTATYLIREAGMAGRPPRTATPDPAHPRVELTIEETP